MFETQTGRIRQQEEKGRRSTLKNDSDPNPTTFTQGTVGVREDKGESKGEREREREG